jgi:hypothetical protein
VIIEYMSGQTFEGHWPAIGLALEALYDRPKLRRQARLLAVYDTRATLIAEVLSTQFGPVVISRIAVDDSATRTRQDSKRNIEPLTGDPEQWFTVTTRRGQYALRADDILAAIRDGKRKIVLERTSRE